MCLKVYNVFTLKGKKILSCMSLHAISVFDKVYDVNLIF